MRFFAPSELHTYLTTPKGPKTSVQGIKKEKDGRAAKGRKESGKEKKTLSIPLYFHKFYLVAVKKCY